MVTRKEFLEPKKFRTYYQTSKNEGVIEFFMTKEANDEFAAAMELMGVTDIEKHYYNPNIQEWFIYSNIISVSKLQETP